MNRHFGQKTSMVSISERHPFWANERHRFENRREKVAQAVTWILLMSWFSVVFISLYGMAQNQRHNARFDMPAVHIHILVLDADRGNDERCLGCCMAQPYEADTLVKVLKKGNQSRGW